MYRTTHPPRPVFGFGRPWTRTVRALILINGAVFLAQIVAGRALVMSFGLETSRPLELWRYVSYMFLHGGPFHLLFNMFALWIFGSEMEDYFGPAKFLRFYFFTGVGAGLSVMALDLIAGQRSMVIGASGAVFGLLVAYGTVYAERTITLLLFFVLPLSMKAKHFVILFGVLEFLFGVSPGSSNIAHFAHLGGMAFGYLFLKLPGGLWRPRSGSLYDSLREKADIFRRQAEDRRMDDLLRKVNEQGIQSLTEEEKQFLHRMSRRKKWH